MEGFSHRAFCTRPRLQQADVINWQLPRKLQVEVSQAVLGPPRDDSLGTHATDGFNFPQQFANSPPQTFLMVEPGIFKIVPNKHQRRTEAAT
ncbi:hypothetical protein PT974_01891 [Cladobotryum mycophilum]|uniref:Uncharacterized protein n=1 Tax=Cladobotryum mycophilum TaxID=491253 RepID=A0ABR0SXP5_9HYPO